MATDCEILHPDIDALLEELGEQVAQTAQRRPLPQSPAHVFWLGRWWVRAGDHYILEIPGN